MELLNKSYAFYLNMLGEGATVPPQTPPPDLLVTEFFKCTETTFSRVRARGQLQPGP